MIKVNATDVLGSQLRTAWGEEHIYRSSQIDTVTVKKLYRKQKSTSLDLDKVSELSLSNIYVM
jgi:hypothetical protein